MGWFVIVKKSTTLVLGVTIIDKILSSMQEAMKNSSRCDRCLRNFLRQIQFLYFKIWASQEACCLSYYFFKYKPNVTKFCTDTKPVSADSLRDVWL